VVEKSAVGDAAEAVVTHFEESGFLLGDDSTHYFFTSIAERELVKFLDPDKTWLPF
jgi:hypothetical protein